MAAASEFIKFVNAAVSPYHAASRMLEAAGFQLISEAGPWAVKAGGSYYFTRNQSSIVALRVAGNGFNIVGAHTDSPVLKVKPVSVHTSGGYLQVGVEPYGGGLWHTWFDRDLTIAGRVMVKENDQYISKLVRVNRPILRIPTLAIHLNREVNSDGFKFNTQNHLLPILSTVMETLATPADAKHHARLLDLLCTELKCKPDEIHDFDLNLVDTQPATIGGVLNEFVFSPRLDNLCMSYCALQALLAAGGNDSDTNVRVMALFDHEEVGSASDHGAASPIIQEVIRRVTTVIGGTEQSLPHDIVEVALRNSFFVSADMAHALHPNYPEKHESHHQPKIHKGIVLKENSNQRYATSAITSLPLRIIAEKRGIPLQEFCVRNDSACGSTIGPIVSSNTGVRTVDIGAPQLSMHSIREMCGVEDIQHGVDLCTAFFEDFSEVDKRIKVDAGTA